jgi:hypothetical protein
MNRYRGYALRALSFPALLIFLHVLTVIVKPGLGNGCATGSPLMIFTVLISFLGWIPGLICGIVGVVRCAFGLKDGVPCKVWLVVSLVACAVNLAHLIVLCWWCRG